MTHRPLSPTMLKLIELLNDVRGVIRAAHQEYLEALNAEVDAVGAFEQAWAEAMLCSEQSTEGLRRAEATIATKAQSLTKRLSVRLRRSARAALDEAEHETKVLEAAFNAYNRELKTELSLAGRE